MRCFGGKRWEKLWIRVKLTILSQSQPHFGGKDEAKDRKSWKWPKFGPILTQSRQLFRPNLQLWVILSHIGVKVIWKSWKTVKKMPMYPPPRNENFWDFSWHCWFWLMYPPPGMGKVVNQVKLTSFLAESIQPHFEIGKNENAAKWLNLAILAQSSHIFDQSNCATLPLATLSDDGWFGAWYIGLKWIWKILENPSPARKIKCWCLDLPPTSDDENGLVDGLDSATPLQPKKWNAHWWIKDDRKSWWMDWNPICNPSPAKNVNLFFGLRSTSGDWPSNPENENEPKCA